MNEKDFFKETQREIYVVREINKETKSLEVKNISLFGTKGGQENISFKDINKLDRRFIRIGCTLTKYSGRLTKEDGSMHYASFWIVGGKNEKQTNNERNDRTNNVGG